MITSLPLPRTAVALVWLYQGFWCKLLNHAPHHQKIVETVPFLSSSQARQALTGLGFFECALAAWVLSGIRAPEAALMQTLLLVSMNTAGLFWAHSLIHDPVGMLLQNLVFLEFETAFLIFAAHELRQHEARVRLLREVARVLRVRGELVLVEHLRDWANLFAFGPGFLHFFSERAWQDAAGAAGMPIRLRRTLTPFVHLFVLQRQL